MNSSEAVAALHWTCPQCGDVRTEAVNLEVFLGKCRDCQLSHLPPHARAGVWKASNLLTEGNQEGYEAVLMQTAAYLADQMVAEQPGIELRSPEERAALRVQALQYLEGEIMKEGSDWRRRRDTNQG